MSKQVLEPPPVFPDMETDLKNYIICPERLPMHQYEKNQLFWDREVDLLELLHYEESPLATTLKVQRDPLTGEITGFKEVSLQSAGENAQNSTSMNRAPAYANESVKGNASFLPFWPGSLPDPVQHPKTTEINSEDYLTVAPGLSRGLNFDSDGFTLMEEPLKTKIKPSEEFTVNLMELVQREYDFLDTWNTQENTQTKDPTTEPSDLNPTQTPTDLPDEEEIIGPSDPASIITISNEPPKKTKGTEWAVILDTQHPVTNFKEKIPVMAIEYGFELDTFQKLAILKLEQHQHVFVAAHTSAGKTVVAEYAIALSQQHMTRTIYTSPIKALSNQKYRDFKQRFRDVGLITGDFQINPTATCLIMTTEILRTMLYCGSEITRDLEYVIFDEVHYINDKERGHVWEQVLIMLPAHVCVVLLSATAPNTVELADWLGRTHQRPVYVISTLQRPVPLKHYLYTGTGGKTKNNKFLILDVNDWKKYGYLKAKECIPESRGYVKFGPKQEENLWYGLVDHLQRNELLPVVAFTFSRMKCDKNASNLRSLDLTSKTEKYKIQTFFNQCLKNFKEPDREIPQVLLMQDILQRGIGIHHSGILPILKEIVEMIFQEGLIKLLFATETFAMGVNMPTRTVVFDSIDKHDGRQRRELLPAEYIQMAGRAGRRGMDSEGTVYILCKNQLPDERKLREMMLGRPGKLQSQFRLTYKMVLSLLRVESIKVEDMMSRSFREADHQKQVVSIEEELKLVEKELEVLGNAEISNYLQPLVKFYQSAGNLLRFRQAEYEKLITSPKVLKTLVPGKLLLISYQHHINKLAIILAVSKSTKPIFTVLVLTDQKQIPIEENKEEIWYKMLSLAKVKVFQPLGAPGHEVIDITPIDILEISSKTIKINTDMVLQDWKNRQIPRFRDNPPGQTCANAIQELYKISLQANNQSINSGLEYCHFIHDLKVNEQDMYEQLQEYYALKDKLIDHLPSTQAPNFEQSFTSVFSKKYLEDKRDMLIHKKSHASLSLYPDYENRIQLLRDLKYIDGNNVVQLKGRVACEIGMNELLITELVLRDVLKDLEAAEVAALLSPLVYRVKIRQEGDNESFFKECEKTSLKNAIKSLEKVHLEIFNLERKLQIEADEITDELNFALINVVYDWASAKPFAEIMLKTEIQEGIIVRCIQQLNDIICDVRDAARKIGDPALHSKMEDASVAIKRDIVFADSLYTKEYKV